MATIGTGLREWAVTGSPAASRISSALPWSAVITSSAPAPSGVPSSTRATVSTTRARHRSIVSRAAIVAGQTPVWPTMSGFA